MVRKQQTKNKKQNNICTRSQSVSSVSRPVKSASQSSQPVISQSVSQSVCVCVCVCVTHTLFAPMNAPISSSHAYQLGVGRTPHRAAAQASFRLQCMVRLLGFPVEAGVEQTPSSPIVATSASTQSCGVVALVRTVGVRGLHSSFVDCRPERICKSSLKVPSMYV
jgi:hypothetical protein